MNRSRVILRSIVGTYLAFAVQLAVTLTVVPLAISQLGDTEYGRWVGLSSISGWATVTDIGVAGLLIAYLSKSLEHNDPAQAARTLWHGLTLSIASAIVGALVLGVASAVAIWSTPNSFRLAQTPIVAAICLAAAVGLGQLGNALSALQHARLMPVSTAIVGIVASVGSLVATVLLLPSLGATALAVGQLTRGVLYTAPLAAWNARFLAEHLPTMRLERATFQPFFTAGLTGMAVRWLQGILGTYDVFSVSTLRGPDPAALYANTARPAGMAVGLSASFGSAIMPSFSRYSSSRSAEESLRVFVACVRLVLAVCGGLALAFVVAYKPLITAWIGAEFVLAPALLAAIAIAAVATAWLGFVSFLFGGTGHFLHANAILFVEGLVRLGAMTAGMIIAGVFGLAIAAAATQIIAVLCYVHMLAKIKHIATPSAVLIGLAGELTLISAVLLVAARYAHHNVPLIPSLFMAAVAATGLFAFLTCREHGLRTLCVNAIRQAVRPAHMAA